MKIDKFPKGLIVSCQALEGNPFRDSRLLAVMSEAAEKGGASAIRANGVEDITEIRNKVNIPIIGIDKKKDLTGRTVITPDFEGAKKIAEAGADIIALDGTFYPSDIREDFKELVNRIHDELNLLVMADISTLDEAIRAAEVGVDAISTTLAGYIPNALHSEEELYVPNFVLLKNILEQKLNLSIVAEGRFWRGEDVTKAFEMGVDAMVIGKAISNPMAISKYYNTCINRANASTAYCPTETVNHTTSNISEVSTEEMLKMINKEDAKVAAIVNDAIPEIANLVEMTAECIENGGKLVYCGAGTSGRLAVADAAECPPTYGLSPDTIKAVIAGGSGAIVNASEGCEDSVEAGIRAFEESGCAKGDVVVGVSASGNAPFVVAFMKEAKKAGCIVGAITNNENSKMEAAADITIKSLTGSEVIKGSTRMKAGTSQKMILNMISTAVCIKLGCVYKNYMVNMTVSNIKLHARAINMIKEITGIEEYEAEELLKNNDMNVKKAVKAFFKEDKNV